MNTKHIYTALMSVFLIVAAACAPGDEESTGVIAPIVSPTPQGATGTVTLSLSDAPLFDYSAVGIGQPSDKIFNIAYSGTASATNIAGLLSTASFAFKDGAYPGTGGTCGAIIASDCTIVVTFSPASTGPFNDILAISYFDGQTTQTKTINLQGTGFLPPPAGTVDTAFGTNGIVTTAFGNHGIAQAAAIQSDGKILLGGHVWGTSNWDMALVRYNTDGSMDTSFGSGGKVTIAPGISHDYGYALAIQNDGKILFSGHATAGSTQADFALIRLNPNGSLDMSFDSDGIVTTDMAGGTDEARAIVVQGDGKILVAGWANNASGANADFALARYTGDGSLDMSFGSGGKVITPVGNSHDTGYGLAVLSDGKILVAGYATSASKYPGSDFALLRYHPDGSLDTNFGSAGKVTTPIGNSWDIAQALAIQSDGKIVLSGSTYDGTQHDFAAARYTSDGSLDMSFGSNGKVKTPIGAIRDRSFALAISKDGKIILAGEAQTDPQNVDVALARYNANGSLDMDFDSDGMLTTHLGNGSAAAAASAIQSDGKILVGGYFYDNAKAEYSFFLIRYWQ